MKRNPNLVCIVISALPVMVLFFLYSRLPAFPHTKIAGSNGVMVSKNIFVAIVVALAITWYFLSEIIAQPFTNLNAILGQTGWRNLINAFLSGLSLLLILSNI